MGAPPQILSMAESGLKGTVEGSLAERMGRVGGKKLPSNHSRISARVKGPCNPRTIAFGQGSLFSRSHSRSQELAD